MATQFFISGAPKSGTTWVQRLTNSHPHIICKGEGYFVDQIIHPMGKLFSRYNRTLQLAAEEVYQGSPSYHLVEQTEFYSLCRLIIDARILRAEDTKGLLVYGDKTPQYYNYFDSLKLVYPAAKFINIVRDPRDVAISRLHHVVRAGVVDGLRPSSKARQDNISQSVENCLNCHRKTAVAREKYPGDILQIKYEDLILDTYTGLAAMMSFLGVPCDDKLLRAIVARNSFSAMTSRAPGESDNSSFLRKGVAGDWRNHLSPQEVDFITARCAEIDEYF